MIDPDWTAPHRSTHTRHSASTHWKACDTFNPPGINPSVQAYEGNKAGAKVSWWNARMERTMVRLLWRRWHRALLTITLVLVVCSVSLHYATQAPASSSGTAFVFYATSAPYACSALVNIDRLRRFDTQHDIVVLATADTHPDVLSAMEAYGARVLIREPPPLPTGSAGYYRYCLLKLRAFWLHHELSYLRRIVVLDADQLVLRNIDSVFQEAPSNVPLSAGNAYWLGNGTLSSTIMVVDLDDEVWRLVNESIHGLAIGKYDMDIINDLFKGSAALLDGQYTLINSHFEDWNVPPWAAAQGLGVDKERLEEDLHTLFDSSAVMHFYALGKPWTYDAARARALRPNAHGKFHTSWTEWRETALRVCLPGTVRHI